ncbi:MAG: BadF/BadG/BcrA/BcrD ATPase family protein [Gemmatimonadota bacterium]
MTYVGVDGGGTRTRAVLVDDEGREIGRGEAPGAVASAAHPERVVAAVELAIGRAVEAAGARGDSTGVPARLWAGLAGAGQAAARDAVHARMVDVGVAREVVIGTDVEAAFASAFPDGEGVLLIAGTGSIAWSRGPDGATRRSGGWGAHLGDEGSGFAIGRAGLALVTRVRDRRASPTTLEATLLDACGVGSADDLVAWVAAASKRDVAALAPLVVEAADADDTEATLLVNRAVADLLDVVTPLRPDIDPTVVLWGGLIADRGPLSGRVVQALEAAGWSVADRGVDPPLGAARLARAGASAHGVPD